jgi:hypothetical protein
LAEDDLVGSRAIPISIRRRWSLAKGSIERLHGAQSIRRRRFRSQSGLNSAWKIWSGSIRQELEPKAKEYKGAQSDIPRRSERRLARGLEDVLHLFLTPSSGGSKEKKRGQHTPPGPTLPEPALPKPHILLQTSTAIDRELLISTLKENTAALDEGMKTIDANVSCAPFGFIDLVAADRVDRICVINVDTFQSDLSILRGVAHVDWIIRNASVVKRMYDRQTIDLAMPPHLFLVAPSFSPLLKCVAQRIAFPKVHCFAYRVAEINETVGVSFERA